MKKFGIRLPIVCALVLLVGVTALATVVSNVKNLTETTQNVKVELFPDGDTNSAEFKVTRQNAENGKQYLLVIRKGEADDPTEDVANLFYMGVEEAKDGVVTFSDAYPKDMDDGTYYVYMSDYGANKLQQVGTFDVDGTLNGDGMSDGKVRYLGDVNESGDITLADVQELLNIFIHNTSLTGDKLLVADVNESGDISMADVQMLLNMFIHNTSKKPVSSAS